MSKTNKKYTTAISACLVGEPCRWNGKNAKNQKAVRIFGQGTSLPICPEILGKLSTPRPACEIVGGDGTDVLQGGAQVCDAKGTCYTKKFVSGARYAVDMIKKKWYHHGIFESEKSVVWTWQDLFWII